MPRPKKKAFGKRNADGTAARKAATDPKPQHDDSSVGAGQALPAHNSSDLMDVDEGEGKAAGDKDVNDEDWCDEDPSSVQSGGGGQSILRFAGDAMVSAARAAGNAAHMNLTKIRNMPRSLSRSTFSRHRKQVRQRDEASLRQSMPVFLQKARRQRHQQREEDGEEGSTSCGGECSGDVDSGVGPHAGSGGCDAKMPSTCSHVGCPVHPTYDHAGTKTAGFCFEQRQEGMMDVFTAKKLDRPDGLKQPGDGAASVGGDMEANGSSDGNMSIASGHRLSSGEWPRDGEIEGAAEFQDDHCGSTHGFLESLDLDSNLSCGSSSSHSSHSSSDERVFHTAPLEKGAEDVRQ